MSDTSTILKLEASAGAWDAFVEQQPEATFCHLAGWREVMTEALGHECQYVAVVDGEGTWRGALPLVRVRSPIFGRFLVSMPFLNYGGPIGTPAAQDRLSRFAVGEARRFGSQLLELRNRSAVTSDLEVNGRKITVTLPLPTTVPALWEKFPSKLLARAHGRFERLGKAGWMAEVLNLRGQVETALGRHTRAGNAYREALAWIQKGEPSPALEIHVRLNLAELYLVTDRFLEAESEARRAEEIAVGVGLPLRLIKAYTVLGRLRGQQNDEYGFVFFEQAVQLCRTTDCPPANEGEVYYEYGLFKNRLGQRDEARAYFDRAREIFEAVGGASELGKVREEIRKLSA